MYCLHISHKFNSDDISNRLCFAQAGQRRRSLYLDDQDSEIYSTIFEQDIDVLGLDDYFDNRLWPKVGGTYVQYDSGDPSFAQLVSSLSADYPYMYIAYAFFGGSRWGVDQRNLYWARLIKAVAPYYDIVVVYAGSGHITFGVNSMPNLLTQRSITFSFYAPLEQNQSQTLFEERLDESMKGMNLSTTESFASIQSERYDYEFALKTFKKNHINQSQTFYVKVTDSQDPAVLALWKYMYQAKMGTPYIAGGVSISVFLQ